MTETGIPEQQATSVEEEIVSSLLANFDCQPVLFVGAGISRRFLGAPDWAGALQEALSVMGEQAPEFDYFFQKNGGDLIACGTDISEKIFEWAWEDKSRFDEIFYKSDEKSIFLKKIIADNLVSYSNFKPSVQTKSEIKALSKIRPHAIITTNYDKLLEDIFIGYEPIVGKGVLKYNLNPVYPLHTRQRGLVYKFGVLLGEADNRTFVPL